jgi:hypothetical protein
MWWKILIGVVILMHGLAHFSGVGAAFAKTGAGFRDEPWLFSQNVFHRGAIGKLWAVFWLAAAVLLVTSAIGLMLGKGWWPTFAIVGAAVSLLAVVPWWKAVFPGARMGALLDVAILVALLGPWSEQIVCFLG